MRQLTTRINGLKLLTRRAPFQTRLILANSLINSKISYLIQLWGGSSDGLLSAIQVCQNAAARAVTRQSCFTPTGVLLRQCCWLSVKQLGFYHTVLTTYKIVRKERPVYLHEKMCQEKMYNTRSEIRFADKFAAKSERAKSSFCYRGALSFNRIPIELQGEKNAMIFKRKLKDWVLRNIDVK